uniref:SFRICE_014763 n=1 Tax=Spodoptera frugiperda TaxID=7108 RepID=A0A2H1VFI6_SPOFR
MNDCLGSRNETSQKMLLEEKKKKTIVSTSLGEFHNGRKCSCRANGLVFDSRVGQSITELYRFLEKKHKSSLELRPFGGCATGCRVTCSGFDSRTEQHLCDPQVVVSGLSVMCNGTNMFKCTHDTGENANRDYLSGAADNVKGYRGSGSKQKKERGASPSSTTYKWSRLTKGLFSHGEGLNIKHHACSMGVGDFNLIISHQHKQQPRESTTGLWVSSTTEGLVEQQTDTDRREIKRRNNGFTYCPSHEGETPSNFLTPY